MRVIRKYQRLIAISFLFTFLNTLVPNVSWAITGHTSMPEYRSFEPVSSSNMVNMFDGSFTYNIPLMDVPNGYPINLSYHSGDVNNETQASWVGLGWTLNPGAINRMKRGFPDEFKGEVVKYHNKRERNWTASASLGADFEVLSSETLSLLGLSVGGTLRFNNYKGFGRAVNVGLSGPAGIANLNLSYSGGRLGFSPSINPAAIYSIARAKKVSKNATKEAESYNNSYIESGQEPLSDAERKNIRSSYIKQNMNATNQKGLSSAQVSFGGLGGMNAGGSTSGMLSGSYTPVQEMSPSVPQVPYDGAGFNFEFSVGPNVLPLPLDPETRLSGTYSTQLDDPIVYSEAFGYFHNEDAWTNDARLMDYYTERESQWEKRDKIMGYPIPNSDVFSMTGEGIGGTFRGFRAEYGHYRKNTIENKTNVFNIGADVNVPTGFWALGANGTAALGTSLSGGTQVSSIGNWNDNLRGDDINNYIFDDPSSINGDENVIFRHSNDLASSFDIAGSVTPYNPDLELAGIGLSFKLDHNPEKRQVGTRNLRSTYIDINSNDDFDEVQSNGAFGDYDYQYKVHSQDLEYIDQSGAVRKYDGTGNRREELYGVDGTGEIVTHNKDGVKYVYGLPIYSRNEKQLSYSLKGDDIRWENPNEPNYQIAEVTKPALQFEFDAQRKLGYEQNAAYASQFLLTEIVSPDYIDRTMNGPSPDDFGSFTKINYQQVAGGEGDWYHHRSPYEGMSYDIGTLSDDRDNTGSFFKGEKELYYVHSIVSKTHVAIFTLEDRDDGAGTIVSNRLSDLIQPESSNGSKGEKLKKLKKIDLYAIGDCNKIGNAVYDPKDGATPIKTVHFLYDYELSQGLPNNVNSEGKLTLKKVWFEYGGKLTSKVNPYEFAYEYPQANKYAGTKYATLDDGYNLSSSAQNPIYNVLNTDRWGEYRDFESMKTKLGDLANFFPFTHQDPDLTRFDPAAHKLKVIKLPSGGEIHVQYEQNDYHYVQDKRVMVMVPLQPLNTTISESDRDKKYYVDLSKIGIDWGSLDDAQKSKVLEDLFEPMNEEKKRLYFKFLYKLIGSDNETPDYTTKNSEFIEGYARIAGYGKDNNGPFFTFKSVDAASGESFNEIDYPNALSQSPNRREVPRQVCLDFYRFNRQGLINNSDNDLADSDDKESLLRRVLSVASQIVGVNERCKSIDPSMSFVRLQFPNYTETDGGDFKNLEFQSAGIKAKRGGGVRVKRLLLFDDSMTERDGSDPYIYGNEYLYQTYADPSNKSKGLISSGVATFEPGVGRRENALVNPTDKDKQTRGQAVLFGRDMYGAEEPLGESLYPAPSVGYSKVIVRNIHSGYTSTGFEIHEFHTCKDFPFKVDKTPVTVKRSPDITAAASRGDGDGGVTDIGFNYERKSFTLTQGYSFILNQMHGATERVTKYSSTPGDIDPTKISEESYVYYEPGEPVKVIDEQNVVSSSVIGKEGEILSEMNQVYDLGISGSLGVDFTLASGTAGPYPFAFGVPSISSFSGSLSEEILRTHVTSKIISYARIVKEVRNLTDGVINITRNTVFDKFTGQPVVVESVDDFEQGYENHDVMASWKYKNMRSTSLNTGLKIANGEIEIEEGITYLAFGLDNCGALDNFSRGDLLEITQGEQVHLYHTDFAEPDKNRIAILRSGYSTNQLSAGELNEGGSVLIVKSGYTNELGVKAGNFVIHNPDGNPYEAFEEVLDNAENQFVKDLNTALNEQTSSNRAAIANGTQDLVLELSLPGIYENINFQVDNCVLDDLCENGNQLSNVKFEAVFNPENGVYNGTEFSLKLKSATVLDENGGVVEEIDCANEEFSAPTEPNENITTVEENFTIKNGNGDTALFKTEISGDRWSSFGSSLDRSGFNIPSECLNFSNKIIDQNAGRIKDNIRLELKDTEITDRNFFVSWPLNDIVIKEPGQELNWIAERFGTLNRVATNFDFLLNGEGNGRNNTNFIRRDNGTFFRPGLYKASTEVDFRRRRAPGTAFTLEVFGHACVPFIPRPRIIINQNDVCDLNNVDVELSFPNYEKNRSDGSVLRYWKDYINQNRIDLSYSWEFWNESNPSNIISSTMEVPDFPFNTPGNYRAKVTVTDHRYGIVGSAITEIIELRDCGQCVPAIVASSNVECITNSIQNPSITFSPVDLTGSNCNGLQVDYLWSLFDPDGSELELSTTNQTSSTGFSYTFSGSGEYLVKLVTVKTLANGTIEPSLDSYKRVLIRDCREPIADILVEGPACFEKELSFSALRADDDPYIEEFEWDMGDGTIYNAPSISHTYNDCKPYYVRLTVSNEFGTDVTQVPYAGNASITCHGVCACESNFAIGNLGAFGSAPGPDFTASVGQFYLNQATGQFVFQSTFCPNTYTFSCLSACGTDPGVQAVKEVRNVIAASATTFSDFWEYDEARYPLLSGIQSNTDLNEYETGEKGNWRPDAQFVYRKQINNNSKIYEAGTFTLSLFDYENLENNDFTNWVNTSNTLEYTPNGEPIEDVNILGVFSTAKYGDNGTLPLLVAQNAENQSVAYEGFEYTYNNGSLFEDALPFDESTGSLVNEAHTGTQAIELVLGEEFQIANGLQINQQALNEGLLSRVWLKSKIGVDALDGHVHLSINNLTYPLSRVSSGGEWQLYEVQLRGDELPQQVGSYDVFIEVDDQYGLGKTATERQVILDDIRLQPLESEMVCYVYDHAQRLVAVLDDQHYAMLYQYNIEGLLIRKLKETIEGVKTISETQYNSSLRRAGERKSELFETGSGN